MKKSSRHMRHVILGRLYTHLQDHYSITLPEVFPPGDRVSLHQLDAMLAFRSDPLLDELRAALDRLEDGSFGLCLACKGEIDEALLDRDPTRRMCDRCEKVYSRATTRYVSLSV